MHAVFIKRIVIFVENRSLRAIVLYLSVFQLNASNRKRTLERKQRDKKFLKF